MNDDQPGPSGGPCQACIDVANTQATGPTKTCGTPTHRLIERLKKVIERDTAVEVDLGNKITALKDQIRTINRNHNAEIEANNARFDVERNVLKAEIEKLQSQLGLRRPHTQRTWQQLVRAHLQQPDPDITWHEIYRQCCKEENMSVTLQWIHPNIRLQGPDIAGGPGLENEAPTRVPEVPFLFEQLPWEIQAKIFRLWLWKEGHLIHALSRLDNFVELQAIPSEEELEGRSGLPRGFYWGKTHYNVTDDRRDPNEVLRLLLVSKRFCFIGVHCFYGLNTFAFSSLGEFDRFCNGIGAARMARLQHIELTWQGNQYLTMPPSMDEEGVRVLATSISRRTYGLYALQDLYRLRTLVVHVNETGSWYIRRRYEPASQKRFMAQKTQGQPNQRMTRSLWCLQGLDCIQQLRGLRWIRFYDLQKAVGERRGDYTGDRVEITDWSFLEGITNVTTMQKVPSRRENSKLENLEPLFEEMENGWSPTEADWAAVKSFYIEENGRNSYDHLRRLGHHRDQDVPSHFSSTEPTEDTDTSGDSDSSSDNSSSDSDTSDGDRSALHSRNDSSRPGPSRHGRCLFRGTVSSRARFRGRSSRANPSRTGPPGRTKAGGAGRIGMKKAEPSLEDLMNDIRNGVDSDSSESDDSDSELDSDTNSNSENRTSLVSDEEEEVVEDGNSVIVVEDDSDSNEDLFVRQSEDVLNSSSPNIPSPNISPDHDMTSPNSTSNSGQATGRLDREDSVIPLPWSPSLQQNFHRELPSHPASSRTGSGSTITPPTLGGGPRRRDSSSSGLFVSQSPTPLGRTGPTSPGVKSEDLEDQSATHVISPDRANEMIDLTDDSEEHMQTAGSLPTIMEIDEDEDEGEADIVEMEVEVEMEGDTLVEGGAIATNPPSSPAPPPSPTGSKRSSGDRNATDTEDEGDGEGSSQSQSKRPRISSPPDRSPAWGDDDDLSFAAPAA